MKLKTNTLFFVYLSISLLLYSIHHIDGLSSLSFLKFLFKPVEIFFHESSHLITALIFNSQDISLHLSYDSGHIIHKSTPLGRPFISFMGYFGASFFGFLIYFSSLHSSKILKGFLLGYTGFFIFFIGDIITVIILTYIISLFFLSWKLSKFGHHFIQFIGIFIMVASIYSPTYLWAYSDSGDHVSMADAIFIPSFIWIILWFINGCFFLYLAFKASQKEEYNKDKVNFS